MSMTLKAYLDAEQIRQADFAERVGTTQATISRICRGGGCSLRLAVRIAAESGGKVSPAALAQPSPPERADA
jgi:transcriptional regulator with XRE-family HTH domain